MKVKVRRIPGYPDYTISRCGKLWSHRRNRSHTSKKPKGRRVWGTTSNPGNYVIVELADGKRYGMHQLVLFTYKGPCPKGLVARHMDGNPSNNHIDNLKWGTYTANNRDKIRHGTITRGEKVNTSKLTAAKVKAIRARLEAGEVPYRLSKEYKVHHITIYSIRDRRSWKHI